MLQKNVVRTFLGLLLLILGGLFLNQKVFAEVGDTFAFDSYEINGGNTTVLMPGTTVDLRIKMTTDTTTSKSMKVYLYPQSDYIHFIDDNFETAIQKNKTNYAWTNPFQFIVDSDIPTPRSVVFNAVVLWRDPKTPGNSYDTSTFTFEIPIYSTNNAPTLSTIPDQIINSGELFQTFDLDDYSDDIDAGDVLTYDFTGNTDLSVNIDINNVVTIGYPASWSGSETVTFTVTDGSSATASTSATFTVNSLPAPETENLSEAKWGPRMVTLQNGKILLVGGYNGINFSLVSADLYNPATGLWSATGNMNVGRIGHTATLLNDGRVLVTGGFSQNSSPDVVTSAEIYNPATGQWTTVASMYLARYSHTATLLGNGKVLIVGGFAPGSYTTETEIYDPVADTWTVVTSMTAGRGEHTATLLQDGRVLVAGGYDGGQTNAAEIYDYTNDTWTTVGNLNVGRTLHSAVTLLDGRVLIAGGRTNTAEIFNPATNIWSFAPSMSITRKGYPLILLDDGRAMALGGNSESEVFAQTEIYDPVSNTWTAGNSMTVPRVLHAGVKLVNGEILIAGGLNNGGGLDSSEIVIP